jgi:hypothetical protein
MAHPPRLLTSNARLLMLCLVVAAPMDGVNDACQVVLRPA